jgi:hypothetical protein
MVPDHSTVALLLLDIVNDLEFPGGERLLRHAVPMARRLARLRTRAKRAGIPVIYVNDNYGRWQSDFRRLTARCRRKGARGKPIVDLLAPAEDDYFVLKPKHSGFFSTTLDVLLAYLGARTLGADGPCGQHLCALHRARRVYAGLPPRRAGGLRGLGDPAPEPAGAAGHAHAPQGGCHPVHPASTRSLGETRSSDIVTLRPRSVFPGLDDPRQLESSMRDRLRTTGKNKEADGDKSSRILSPSMVTTRASMNECST